MRAPRGPRHGYCTDYVLEATLLTLLALISTLGLASPPAPDHAVWAYPLASALGGLAQLFYLPVGVETRLGPATTLVAEGAPMHGRFYTCDSTSSGGILSAGVAFYGKEQGAFRGAFIQPKLRARVLNTPRPHGYCRAQNEQVLRGWDGEAGLGVDVGFAWSPAEGPGLFAALAVGYSRNLCFNCFEPNGTFMGDPFRGNLSYLFMHSEPTYSRRTSPTWAANINLVRVGGIW